MFLKSVPFALLVAFATLGSVSAKATEYVVMVVKPTLKVSAIPNATPVDPAPSGGTTPAPAPAPALSADVSSTTLSFGDVPLASGPSQSVALLNTGDTALTFSTAPYLSAQSSRTFTASTTCGTTLAPQASCLATVTLRPTALGAVAGSFVFPTNAANGPHTVALSGRGVGAHYETFINGVASHSLPAFTGVQIGATSAPATFEVHNTGNLAGTPTLAASPSAFAISGCTTAVAPGGSCIVSVTFTPASATALAGAVQVSGSADSGAFNVDVSGTGAAVDGSNWQLTASLGRDNWYGMAFGAGKFLTVGAGGKVLASVDGANWSSPATIAGWSGTTDNEYLNGQFVSLASSRLAWSADGATWNVGGLPSGSWNSAAYGNGVYVTVDASNNSLIAAASSPAGPWGSKAVPGRWYRVAFGAGRFIASGFVATSTLVTSTDGVNWTSIPNPLPGANQGGIAFVNGRFILVQGAKVAVSTDGVSWSVASSPVDFSAGYPYIAYGGGTYVVLGSGTRLITSTDGVTWTAATPPNQSWSGIAYGNGHFAATTYNGYYLGYTR